MPEQKHVAATVAVAPRVVMLTMDAAASALDYSRTCSAMMKTLSGYPSEDQAIIPLPSHFHDASTSHEHACLSACNGLTIPPYAMKMVLVIPLCQTIISSHTTV